MKRATRDCKNVTQLTHAPDPAHAWFFRYSTGRRAGPLMRMLGCFVKMHAMRFKSRQAAR